MIRSHRRRALLAAVCVASLPALAPGAVPAPGAWSMLFADEFNGSSLDNMKWTSGYWEGTTHGLADSSVELPQNTTVAGGNLVFTARNDGAWANNNYYPYTSGAVTTQGKLNFTYGYIEASQKFSNAQGTWPAFWMLQEHWPPEIDIEEYPNGPASGSNANTYNTAWHYTNSSNVTSSAGPGLHNTGTDLSAGYHYYAVDWEPTSLTFYFDGNSIGSISGSQYNIAQAAGMYLLLDMGVGGWPGAPTNLSSTTMQTDFVRVWQHTSTVTQLTWNHAGNSGWDTASNWNGGGTPNQSTQNVVFGTLSGSPAAEVVDWSGSRTVNGLTFQSNTSYTIGASATTATASSGAALMLTSGDGVPTTAETVYITANNSAGQSTTTINARLEVPYSSLTLAVTNHMTAPMTFNGDLIGTGNLNLTAGAMVVNGDDQMTGSVTVAGGGTLQVNGKVSAASQILVASGTLQISAGSTVTANSWMSIGSATGGTGRLNMSGGTLNANYDFNIGDVNGSTGILTLSGGTITAVNFWLGKSGNASGTIIQSGGTINASSGANDWRIGGTTTADTAAVGLYNLSGGSFTTLGNFQLGAYGRGTINQTGGTVTVGAYLSVGRFAGGVGVFNMASGSGVLTDIASASLIIGEAGNGTLLVGGTSVVNAQTLAAGYAAGGVGVIQQTGGTVNASVGVSLGGVGTGTYNLAGGVLVTPNVIRGTGTGTFNFNGGTLRLSANTPTLLAGLTAVNLQAGGGTIDTNGYNGSMGGLTGTGPLSKAGLGTLTETGALTPSALLVRGGQLAVNGTTTVSSYSSIGQLAGDNGSVAVNSGGKLVVTGDLNVAETGNTTTTVTGSLNLSAGGTTNTRNLYVGKTSRASGTINQTGGNFIEADNGTAPTDWRLGGATAADNQAVGIINLSGGNFSTGSANLMVGSYGRGTMTQTGGTATVGGTLTIGASAGSVGVVNLNGGTLNAAVVVGDQGTGTMLVRSTGTLNATSLSIGPSGMVNQSGGVVTSSTETTLNGLYVLTGGRLSTTTVGGNGGLTLAGGTFAPTGAVTGLAYVRLGSAGGTIDTGSSDVTLTPTITTDPSIIGVDGGLTKLGAGILTVSNTTYGGPTNILGGSIVYANGSLSTVTAAVTAGYAGGTWTGPGITSSLAANDPSQLTALGVGPGPAGGVEVALTYYGDANLDGKIDGSDYSLIDAAFGTGAVGWSAGDFNYDGVVDGSDYTLIDNGFNRQSTPLTPTSLAATELVATPAAAVPEPSVLVALVPLLPRRRR